MLQQSAAWCKQLPQKYIALHALLRASDSQVRLGACCAETASVLKVLSFLRFSSQGNHPFAPVGQNRQKESSCHLASWAVQSCA